MEAKDPAVKLFGKEIALPENGKIPVVSGGDGWVEGGCYDNDLSSVMSACLEGKKVSRTGDEEQEDEEEEKEVEAADKVQFRTFVHVRYKSANLRRTHLSECLNK